MNCKFVRWILGILGFSTAATSCELIEDVVLAPAMYGCPSADYVFNVEIEDMEGDTPINGVRVSVVERGQRQYWNSELGIDYYEPYIDTLAVGVTAQDGKVMLKYNGFPRDKHEIVADDVDGAENGGNYASASVEVLVEKEDYKNPGNNGWYSGTATSDVTLRLSKK